MHLILEQAYGNDAEFLYEKNFNVICVDKSEISKQYINEKNKNIKVLVEQFENVTFDNYDLVYSNLGIIFCNKNYIDELINKIVNSKLSEDSKLYTTTWDNIRKSYNLNINDTITKNNYEKTIKGE